MIESIEQGRKEDGNRSIADKIIKRLHDLEKTIENNRGRWVWELLQNAKDSISDCPNTKVAVEIELEEDQVTFRHNGLHFTEKDIRGLINQISSKEVDEGEVSSSTGRFGTGFLTTHLLSRVVDIKGIVETQNGELFKFEFPLNREGKTTKHLVPNIENAWEGFHRSVSKISPHYDKNELNTSFCYNIESEEQKDIAYIGLEEFTNLIPFVLVFVPKIESVRIVDKINEKDTLFQQNVTLENGLITSIIQIENGLQNSILVLSKSNSKMTIAVRVQKADSGYEVISSNSTPKLFCDFPLIGTESFHFPVIINSFYFNPQTERDGVWLKGNDDKEVEENRDILKNAVTLYKQLIEEIGEEEFFNLYNIAESKIPSTNRNHFDEDWFKLNIQAPIRDVIFNSKLVELEGNSSDKKTIKELWFPQKTYSEKVKERLWQFFFDLFPEEVCKKEHLKEWSNVSWKDWSTLTYSELISDIEEQKDISSLALSLETNENEAFDWLNNFSKFLLEDETNQILFERSTITPNRYGTFRKRSELNIDKIKDESLIEILSKLGEDWKNILINDNVTFGKYAFKEKKDIAGRITEILKHTRDKGTDYIQAVTLLSEWFDNHSNEMGKDLFSELYRKKAELFMNTISDKDSLYKVMRSKTDLAQLSKIAQAVDENPQLLEKIKIADDVSTLLKEFDVTSLAELKALLNNSNNGQRKHFSKVEITQDVLASLGISSIEELEEALKDQNLAELFHSSRPNVSAFLYAQGLISRAKNNIIAHLKTEAQYKWGEIEELAPTVLGGIMRNDVPINIVVRPSDNGEVIIYYSSEKDTLDYTNAELWIDNGIQPPKHLTLGRILKTTGINKIPV